MPVPMMPSPRKPIFSGVGMTSCLAGPATAGSMVSSGRPPEGLYSAGACVKKIVAFL